MREPGDPGAPSLQADPWAALREVRAELARTTWWRRLVHARLDLAVARTAGPRPLAGSRHLRDPREALVVPQDGWDGPGVLPVDDDVPAADELLALLSGAAPDAEVRRLLTLRDLDARLARPHAVAARGRHADCIAAMDACHTHRRPAVGP